jgi:uncharacterized protein (UPF0332 family)
MSFELKAVENLNVAKNCSKKSNSFNVGASRAYYAAFQKIKGYLLNEGFDYRAFLKKINKETERDFSHGTIIQALYQHILDKQLKGKSLSQVNVLDNLYSKRKKADYQAKMITNAELADSCQQAEKIISFVDSL